MDPLATAGKAPTRKSELRAPCAVLIGLAFVAAVVGCEEPTNARAPQGSSQPAAEPVMPHDSPADSRLSIPDANDAEARHRRRWRPRTLARAAIVAAPVAAPADAKRPAAKALHPGDGWGCATLHDGARYCWIAPNPASQRQQRIVAQRVSWLEDAWLGAGPDRLCVDRGEQGVRCWRAPDFITRPWWSSGVADAASESRSWSATRGADGVVRDPTPVTHGAFRGCSGDFCWGSTPGGTTPAAHALCRGARASAPCAVADERALRQFERTPHIGSVLVGDLFACLRGFEGVLCIGASRDGFFGVPKGCPPALRRGWPTSSSSVAAPLSSCANAPVLLRSRTFGNAGFAGPRGVCLEVQAQPRSRYDCYGAIPSPRGSFAPIVPGLGEGPSACGIDAHGQVHCWGAGYSRDPRAPVPVEPRTPESTVAWSDPGRFGADCAVNRRCARSAPTLPACPRTSGSTTVDALLTFSRAFEDERVRVSGRLVLAAQPARSGCEVVRNFPFGPTPDDEGPQERCCQDSLAPAAVTDGRDYVVVEGAYCSGDASRMCCDTPVLGQSVVATGRLVFRKWIPQTGPMWTLADASLCEVH